MINFILQIIAAYFVGYTCSICVQTPPRQIYRASVIAATGWLVYLICLDFLTLEVGGATYIASLAIAGMSQWFSRRYHQPVTVFFIPGFYTLVPGGGMYRTALYLIQSDYSRGLSELATTMFTALAIALAVFTADTVIDILRRQRELEKKIRNWRQ
ncbi:threonine/serine exporter family protein [Aerococcus sp. UMB7834]|uniref:threonine/serine exporter family protein n=1 Tax=Aerococcus sp. UMB7834 TaxID=3046342 RepID=UPI00254B5A64|nr:threonine/serine exporter family protein [Aerococcus sp. UMB7834]MDK6805680.1 threonine/serine exporter family protein [Aerococcus sp. UMB7834]